MEFYNKGKDFFTRVEYTSPKFLKYDKFKSCISDIINNNRKVLVYGDYDPDGLYCALQWKEFFHLVRHDNYQIFKYVNRTHALDIKAKQKAIFERFDYIIINDAASGDMEAIETLVSFGVKVILIDHHQTKYCYDDYPENAVIINSVLENRESKDSNLTVSAGALVFMLLYKVLDDYRIPGIHLSAYALASLYADSIDMSSEYNRGIYFMATSLDEQSLPLEIACFLNNYMKFCRRFVEFHMIPKINSAFRSEDFGVLNACFLTEKRVSRSRLLELVDYLAALHKTSAEMVGTASDIVYHEVLDNFVLANLNSVNMHINIRDNKLNNYTGLIANKLGERYKKSVVVYCGIDGNIKGSFRDLYGRNYLSIFQQFTNAEGHNAAFGINMKMMDIHDFIKHLKIVDSRFNVQANTNEPIIMRGYQIPPDVYALQDMAIYNEFAGNQSPLALIEVARRGDMHERPSGYGGYIYTWGDRTIHCRKRTPVGTKLMIRPTIGKTLKMYAI